MIARLTIFSVTSLYLDHTHCLIGRYKSVFQLGMTTTFFVGCTLKAKPTLPVTMPGL